jgi:hypothetical protein
MTVQYTTEGAAFFNRMGREAGEGFDASAARLKHPKSLRMRD